MVKKGLIKKKKKNKFELFSTVKVGLYLCLYNTFIPKKRTTGKKKRNDYQKGSNIEQRWPEKRKQEIETRIKNILKKVSIFKN